ncbi:hypothetical protein SXCC_02171 [Gluconacetobacter sp. SXCC-1]|nr:hypothetical protein SXCC_02171 [Gluconacetobacter sp. SXCC-1]
MADTGREPARAACTPPVTERSYVEKRYALHDSGPLIRNGLVWSNVQDPCPDRFYSPHKHSTHARLPSSMKSRAAGRPDMPCCIFENSSLMGT